MANYCWTNVQIYSVSDRVHDLIDHLYEELGYDDIKECVEALFGSYKEYPFDKVGSKWIHLENGPDREGDDLTTLRFCSAWSFPAGYIEKLLDSIIRIDQHAYLTFDVDEESDDFIIGGCGNSVGFKYYEEESPERPDYEDDDYDALIDDFYDEVFKLKESFIDDAIKYLNE